MRLFSRVSVLFVVAVLSAGPLMAAPMLVSQGASVHAPQAARSPLAGVLHTLGYGAAAFGAIRLKDIGSLSKKFVQRAGAAGNDYTEGVKSAGNDWETRTRASGDTYAGGVQQAIADKRYEKGVSEAGAARYVQKASTLGAQRYPTGVAASEGDWAKGFQPYHAALSSMDLPARRPKGDPANQQISNAVAQRLAAIKRGR